MLSIAVILFLEIKPVRYSSIFILFILIKVLILYYIFTIIYIILNNLI